MPERFTFPAPKSPEYTKDKLKTLLLKAVEAEIASKEKELSRPLSEEEKRGIKITREFLQRHHATGLIPSVSTFEGHFGSVISLAHALGLPGGRSRPREIYFESEKGTYINSLKIYVVEFKKQNGRLPTRQELREAVLRHEIADIPTSIFKYFDVFAVLGIPGSKRS